MINAHGDPKLNPCPHSSDSTMINKNISELVMSKDQKLSCVQLEDLPDEIVVKIWLLKNNGFQAQ